jgi:hypothetical protein
MKVSLLMVFLKAMVSIYGAMVVNTKEILNKVIETVMEYGQTKKKHRNIKVIICLIKNMASEFIIFQMTIFIKEIMWKM